MEPKLIARNLHYELIDMGLPNDGLTNSNARKAILHALATPASLGSSYNGEDAAVLVALADQLDALAGQAAASQVPDASGTDFLRLLVKSRPQLTAALRAQAATPAPGCSRRPTGLSSACAGSC